MEITLAYRSHFVFMAGVDLDAKVSCQKGSILGDQAVASVSRSD